MKTAFAALLCALASVLNLSALELVENGKSAYTIALPDQPTPVEMQAAIELQQYLQDISGAELPMVPGFAGDGPAIRIGRASGLDPASFKTDEILLKTAGGDLLLDGGAPRGPLYAVYELLEEQFGVRWWTSYETFIPEAATLSLGELDVRYAPPIVNRESFYHDVIKNPAFASHLRCNGHFEALGPEYGGHNEILGFCHTMDQLVPRSVFGADHPDWYEEIDGVRDPQRFHEGQPCPMSPGFRARMTETALDWLRRHPDPRVISITQNDNYHYCRCARCLELIEAEESPIAPLLDLVNQFADAIRDEFPQVKVETLAYQYTRKAPKTMRPRDNVIIRLCSIECDFSQPLDSEANAAFRDDLLAWAAIAPELAIWNYVTNFSNYLVPHPNLTHLGDDIRFFAGHRVTALFEQGDYQSGGQVGDFVALRAWLLAKLMWDPSRDQDTLIDEFLTGYYGAENATVLRRYLEMLEQAAADSGVRLSCFMPDTRPWLPDAGITEAREILDRLRWDETGAARLDKALLPLAAVLLERLSGSAEERNRILTDWDVHVPEGETWVGVFRNLTSRFREYGVENWNEAQSFDLLEERLIRRAGEIAAETAQTAEGE